MPKATFFRDSHDRDGVQVDVPWAQIAERCTRHEIGPKDGPAICAGVFSGTRLNANLVGRTLVGLDIETSSTTGEVPVPVDAMVDYLTARRVQCVVWTTHSHTTEKPRYRVLLPLEAPIPYQPDIDPYISAAVAAELRCIGVCDQSKYGAASLFYLPRHPPHAEHKAVSIAGLLMSNARLETAAFVFAQRIAQDEAERAAMRRAQALPPEIVAKIAAYNETHSLVAELERYGYRRDGMRWKSPLQSPNSQAATSILPDGKIWTSFSESDAAAGLGQRPARPSSQCTCWGDCFSLYTFWQHRGNFRAALNSLEPNAAHR